MNKMTGQVDKIQLEEKPSKKVCKFSYFIAILFLTELLTYSLHLLNTII